MGRNHRDEPTAAAPGGETDFAVFSSLLEDNAEDLYENAPCGYLSTLLDGRIAKINKTLLNWLGYTRDELVGRRSFSDLLNVGGQAGTQKPPPAAPPPPGRGWG